MSNQCVYVLEDFTRCPNEIAEGHYCKRHQHRLSEIARAVTGDLLVYASEPIEGWQDELEKRKK